ncbi:Ras GTPase-activating protein-binding protein 1-like protein isoform X1 [Tanacetum coccineum]
MLITDIAAQAASALTRLFNRTLMCQDINSKIISLNYHEFRAEIKSVDAQESWNGGVNVLVIGFLTGKDNVVRKFTQSFFLAPQDKGLKDLSRDETYKWYQILERVSVEE